MQEQNLSKNKRFKNGSDGIYREDSDENESQEWDNFNIIFVKTVH